MVRHIVIWKIKDTTSKDDLLDLKNKSEALKNIPGVVDLKFIVDAMDSSTHDICLNGLYESKEALDNYQVNPIHKEFGSHLKPLVCERIAFDYNE